MGSAKPRRGCLGRRRYPVIDTPTAVEKSSRWLLNDTGRHYRMGPEKGKEAEVKKTVKSEAAIGLQPGTVGGHASPGIGPVSAIGAALHYLIHPRTRKKIAAEARADTERGRRPRQGPGVSGSPTEAAITGGLSLLLDSSNTRRRR